VGFKDEVLSIIERGYQAELDFIQGLSEEERTACGMADKWCAKDIMAHNAFWKEHLANNIQAVARGEAPTPVDDYDQANLECFEENKDRPCDDIVGFSERIHGLIAEVVRTMDENALQSEEAWPGQEGRPAWQSVVGTSYTHPITHLAQYHAEDARGKQATKLWKDAVELLGGLDESPRWQGLMHYNQACMCSLAGMYDAAVDELRQALQLRPDLTEWSKQDPDLNPLRERDDYQTLYSA
jgi:hypothetical protein